MSYRSVMQNVVPYTGPALIGLYHTINEPFYYGGENSWQVDVDIDVDDALINVAGIASANVGILDVASFQSSYQVSEGVLSGITSTNRLNLRFDPNISIGYVLTEYSPTALAPAGIGTDVIPAIVAVGDTGVAVGDKFVDGVFDVSISGIMTGIGSTALYVLSGFTTTATTSAGVGTNIVVASVSVGATTFIEVDDQLINGNQNIPIIGFGSTSIFVISGFTTTAITDSLVGDSIVYASVSIGGTAFIETGDKLINDGKDIVITGIGSETISLGSTISAAILAGSSISFKKNTLVPSIRLASGISSGISTGDFITFRERRLPIYVPSGFSTSATAAAGVGTNIVPAVVSIGLTTYIEVGDKLINGDSEIHIIGIGTTSVSGLGLTTVISLASTISSGIATGDILTFKERIPIIALGSTIRTSGITTGTTLRFKKSTWIDTSWVSDEGGTVIDVDLSTNMVIVGGIATVPVWNFKNYSSQNSRMATVSVVGISTRIISGAGASDAVYTPGNVSAGSAYKLNGEWQYYSTDPVVYKEIMWEQGTVPDFVDSQMTLITFRILNDDAGNVYILGSKSGPFFQAP